MNLTVLILTKDEEKHLGRAIASVAQIANRVVVVDSGSADRTVDIARDMGAKVLVHPFVNQAHQFNWALDQLPNDTDWVFRLDADEVVSPELAQSLQCELASLDMTIAGARIYRRMAFMGRPIRWGGVFPISIARVFRYKRGRSEDRWMDEHIVIDGPEIQLNGELLDDNRKSLTWWIDKHNNYASREVVEILDAQYKFLNRNELKLPSGQSGLKRRIKARVYSRLPSGFRVFLYFFYRFVIRFGFMDGPEGRAFHVLQSFWYRYLIDLKLSEINRVMRDEKIDIVSAISKVLNVDVKGG